ncbi:uncharacterized protein BT62DRAFT_836675, partial [Guyanagaster necrorhizus]
PLLGNLGDFTSSVPWLATTQWAKKTFLGVCYLHVFEQEIIFLSSEDAASDFLNKRGAIYSVKPKLKMVGEFRSNDFRLPFLNYDSESFARQQRFVKKTLGLRSITDCHPMIRASTNTFLSEIINSLSHHLEHSRKYAGGLVLSVVYGYQACNADDKFLKQAEFCLDIIANEI